MARERHAAALCDAAEGAIQTPPVRADNPPDAMYHDDPHEQVFELIAARRFDEAAGRLEEILGRDPENASGFALRALCLAQVEEWRGALESGKRAIELDPSMAFAHWSLAHVLADRQDFRAAVGPARAAVRLDAGAADHHALLARIEAASGRWDDALRSAETALSLERGHPGAQRTRALVLQHRGRAEEADSAFLNALIQDPDDAFAYAGRGWSMLRVGGDSGSAVEHFQAALRIAPDSAWAREGLIAALKARNPVYRVMLRYFFWLGSLPPRSRMMIVVGGLIGYSVLRRVAAAQPALAPLIWPLLGLYILFLVLSWTAEPLFDSLLRLSPVGRAALTQDRIRASTWVLGILTVALALAIGSLVSGYRILLPVALVFGLLVLPVSGTFHCEPGWPRLSMAALSALTAALILATPFLPEPAATVSLASALGLIILGSWVNRWLASVTPVRRPV